MLPILAGPVSDIYLNAIHLLINTFYGCRRVEAQPDPVSDLELILVRSQVSGLSLAHKDQFSLDRGGWAGQSGHSSPHLQLGKHLVKL